MQPQKPDQKQSQSTSDYLRSLENAGLKPQSNSELLQQQLDRNKQREEYYRNTPSLSELQDQADQTREQSLLSKRKQDYKKSDAEKRLIAMRKLTGTKGYMVAGMGASYIKPLGAMLGGAAGAATGNEDDSAGNLASKIGLGAVGGALLGTTGGLYQGGMKSIGGINRVNRSLKRQQYGKELGTAGKIQGLTSVINNAARLSYTANLIKGLASVPMGGSIAPTSSMMGKMNQGIGAIAGKGSVFGGGTGGIVNSMTSPAALAMGVFGVASMFSNMATQKKMRKLMVVQKTSGDLERKYSKAKSLDGFYKQLRAQEQITPQQQLQYTLLSYIEGHTSVLPKLLSVSKATSDKKDKADKQVDNKYSKKTGISDDPEMKKHDSVFKRLENAINTISTKYDPISQLTSFILTGSAPKKILEDINNAKGLTKQQLEKKDEQSRALGISTNQLRLLGINSASLITSLPSYESKMLALTSASFDMNRLIAQESVTIRKHGLGVDHNSFTKPITKTGLFGKLENVINLIPGLSAGFNIIKDTLLLPKKIGDFTSGLFKGGMNALFGKDFLRLQDQTELDKELGIEKSDQLKATEYTAVGLPTHMEKIRTLTAQQLDVQYNIFEVLKNQYELSHQQLTGSSSNFGYKQKINDNIIQERVWDSFEKKMLTGEGFDKAIKKRQKLRTLKRESAFKKSLVGKMSLLMTDEDNFITPIEQRMEKIFTPLNKLSQKFKGGKQYVAGDSPFVVSQEQKDDERDIDIRKNIRGDKNVRDISLDVERKRDIPDIAGNSAASAISALGGLAALSTGPLGLGLAAASLLTGGGIGAITKKIMGTKRTNKLDQQEINELTSVGLTGRNVGTVQEEINRRSNIVNKTQSNPSIISLIDQQKIIPDKIQVLHEMIDNRFGEVVQLFSLPVEVKSTSISDLITSFSDLVKTGIENVVNKLSSRIEVDVKSNVFSNYKFDVPNVGEQSISPQLINSGSADGYVEAVAAAGGGKLSPFTVVGEEGPELIIGNQVFNQKQAKLKFGINISDLISQPNITKLADGGELPPDNSFADDYTIFSQIKGILLNISNKIFNIFDFLKEKTKSAEVKHPKNKVIDIATKLKEDQEEKKRRDDLEIQNILVSNSNETVKHLKLIVDNTKEKSKLRQSFDGIIQALMSTLGGLAPLIAGGAALAAFFTTGGKIGTTALAGIAGKIISAVLTNVGKIFDKSGPELLGSIFEKSSKLLKAPIDSLIKPMFTKLSNLFVPAMKSLTTKFYDNFLKFWPETITKFKIPVKPDFSIITDGYKITKTFFKKISTKFYDNVLEYGTTAITKAKFSVNPGFYLDMISEGYRTATSFMSKYSTKIFDGIISKSSNVVKAIPKIAEKFPGLQSIFKKVGSQFMESMGFKGLSKLGAKGAGKAIGKMVPFLGLIMGGYFAVKRLLNNDVVGAIGELASGFASTFPGVGTAISLGLDVWLALRDSKREQTGEATQEFNPASVAGAFLKNSTKWGSKLLGVFAKGGLKTFGKKIPFLGAPIGMYFAWERFKKEDYFGAMLELASGLSSIFPGIGTAVGFGIDALLLLRDSKSEEGDSSVSDPKSFDASFLRTGPKVLGKIFSSFAKGGLKSFGKKIPILGSLVGLYYAYQRFNDGDYIGSLMELASGLTSVIPIPGLGTALGIGMDALIMLRDSKNEANDKIDKDGNKIEPGWFSRLGTFVFDGFAKVSDWVMNKVYNTPIIGGFIKSFVTGTKNELFEVADLMKIDELNDKDGNFSFFNRITSMAKAVGRLFLRGVPYIGHWLESSLLGNKDINKELETAMKNSGAQTPGMAGMDIGQDVISKQLPSTLSIMTTSIINKTADFFNNKVPIIGSTLSNWMLGKPSEFQKEIDSIKLEEEKNKPNFVKIVKDFFSDISSRLYNMATGLVTGTFTKIKESIFGKSDDPKEIKKDKIVSTPVVPKVKSSKDTIKELIENDVINSNWGRNDKIDNWEAISNLSENELNAVIKHNDWDKETEQKLLEIKKKYKKPKVVSTPQTQSTVSTDSNATQQTSDSQSTFQKAKSWVGEKTDAVVNAVAPVVNSTVQKAKDVVNNNLVSTPQTQSTVSTDSNTKTTQQTSDGNTSDSIEDNQTWIGKRWNTPIRQKQTDSGQSTFQKAKSWVGEKTDAVVNAVTPVVNSTVQKAKDIVNNNLVSTPQTQQTVKKDSSSNDPSFNMVDRANKIVSVPQTPGKIEESKQVTSRSIESKIIGGVPLSEELLTKYNIYEKELGPNEAQWKILDENRGYVHEWEEFKEDYMKQQMEKQDYSNSSSPRIARLKKKYDRKKFKMQAAAEFLYRLQDERQSTANKIVSTPQTQQTVKKDSPSNDPSFNMVDLANKVVSTPQTSSKIEESKQVTSRSIEGKIIRGVPLSGELLDKYNTYEKELGPNEAQRKILDENPGYLHEWEEFNSNYLKQQMEKQDYSNLSPKIVQRRKERDEKKFKTRAQLEFLYNQQDRQSKDNNLVSTPKNEANIQAPPITQTEPLIHSFAEGGILTPGLNIVGEGKSGEISKDAELVMTSPNNTSTVIPAEITKQMGITRKDLIKPNPSGGMSSLPQIDSSKTSGFDPMKFFEAFNSQVNSLVGNVAKSAIGKVANLFSGKNGEIKPDQSNLNKSIQDVVKNHVIASEGMVLHKYKDTLGYDTVGVGHLIKPGEDYSTIPNSITVGEAKSLFDKDYRAHEMLASKIPEYGALSDVRKGALIDMVFNMGLGGVKGFTNTLRKLGSGDFKGAADGIRDSKYYNQVGSRAERIAKIIETNDPSYFNSNKPQITAMNGASIGQINIEKILRSNTNNINKMSNNISKNFPFNSNINKPNFKKIFSNVSSKISDGIKYTGEGTSGIDATLHPGEIVFGKGKFEGLMDQINKGFDKQIRQKIDSKRMDISSVLAKTREFEKEQLNNIKTQTKEQKNEKTTTSTQPVILNNNTTQPIMMPQNNRQDTEGKFTNVDDSLDRLTANLFNASSNSLISNITDFVFKNSTYI